MNPCLQGGIRNNKSEETSATDGIQHAKIRPFWCNCLMPDSCVFPTPDISVSCWFSHELPLQKDLIRSSVWVNLLLLLAVSVPSAQQRHAMEQRTSRAVESVWNGTSRQFNSGCCSWENAFWAPVSHLAVNFFWGIYLTPSVKKEESPRNNWSCTEHL